MSFSRQTITDDQHQATAQREIARNPKGKIVVEFDSPAGLSCGIHRRKCKPSISKDGSITIQAFRGIWRAIPSQLFFDGKPVMVVWSASHIRWTDEVCA